MIMNSTHTPGPWQVEIYLNEKNVKLPPHIIGAGSNYEVADCCGANETDLANGHLISAAPDLLKACEAAILALAENPRGLPLTDASLNAVSLCRTACDKAYQPA
jgi:hypothetical protein